MEGRRNPLKMKLVLLGTILASMPTPRDLTLMGLFLLGMLVVTIWPMILFDKYVMTRLARRVVNRREMKSRIDAE